jgi:hypothetical protein
MPIEAAIITTRMKAKTARQVTARAPSCFGFTRERNFPPPNGPYSTKNAVGTAFGKQKGLYDTAQSFACKQEVYESSTSSGASITCLNRFMPVRLAGQAEPECNHDVEPQSPARYIPSSWGRALLLYGLDLGTGRHLAYDATLP